MKPFKVEFEFTDTGYTVIVADSEENASKGVLQLLNKRGIKNPNIINVEDEGEEQLELPFGEPSQSIN